ncbi:hypothetical protein TIFTF001_004871 [Ficus carica]|uniref:Uncharacterized protein n=1 Tax=Ficus carica TaxID=3494 RepID=A0AA87ZWK5_FICCA|nr:hypothetical protein TIFTF001_004871 [Ficus carica]
MWLWWQLRKLQERSLSSATRLSKARSQIPKHACFWDFRQHEDSSGSPKLRDSFFGDLTLVAVTVIGDLGLGFD